MCQIQSQRKRGGGEMHGGGGGADGERPPLTCPVAVAELSAPGARHSNTLLFRGDSCLHTHTHTQIDIEGVETFAVTSWNCLTFPRLTPLRLCTRRHLCRLLSLWRRLLPLFGRTEPAQGASVDGRQRGLVQASWCL